jgi:hypothetical protein
MEDDIAAALSGAGGGSSGVLLDADGVPYFEPGVAGGPTIQADTDGVPYFN